MSEPINLADPIRAICERLGLEPNDVLRLDLYPARTVATVCKKRNGSKYVDGTGDVAVDVVEMETSSL